MPKLIKQQIIVTAKVDDIRRKRLYFRSTIVFYA